MRFQTICQPIQTTPGAWKIRTLLAVVAGLVIAAQSNSMNTPIPEEKSQGKLYVAVPLSATSGNTAILRFDNPAMLSGNVTPTAMIAGNFTRLNTNTISMAQDPMADRLFVLKADIMTSTEILVFDHISQKSGNVAPDRVITGLHTGMNTFGPIALDSIHDVLYAAANIDASSQAGIVTFKHASTTSGNVPPNSILKMSGATPAGAINDLASDAANDRLFMLMNNQKINVADNVSTRASGTLTPDRVITSSTGFSGTTRIVLDPAGRLLVGNTSGFIGHTLTPAHIAILANAATADGDVSPTATISGSVAGLNVDGPRAMTIVTSGGSSSIGDLYVNIGSGTVLVFKNIARAKGNILPNHVFTFANNGSNDLEFSRNSSR